MASLLPKLNPEFTGVNPKTGEYLSPDERKQVFKLRKRKLDPSKVFDKSAIVKVDKPQANMDSVMKSIINIQETLQKLTNFIVTEAEEKKKDTRRENRQLLLAGEKEERKKKEGLLEKVPERLKSALLAPIKAVGEQAKGVLSRLMEAFTLIFTGWLTDKGLKAIQAFMDGDKDKLKEIGKNVIKALTVVGGIFLGINLALLALPALIIKAIGVIATLGTAIVGFLLSPVGLGVLAGAGLLFGLKGIYDLTRNAITGGSEFTKKHDELDQILKDYNIRKVGNSYKVFTGSEKQIAQGKGARRDLNEEEQKILNEVLEKRVILNETHSKMDAEVKEAIANAEPDATRKSRQGSKYVEVPYVSQKKKDEIRKRIEQKYINKLNNVSDASNLSGNQNISKKVTNSGQNLGPLEDDGLEVVYNNQNVKERGKESLKSGDASDVPLYASSNSENFYSTYSQLQYGVVV